MNKTSSVLSLRGNVTVCGTPTRLQQGLFCISLASACWMIPALALAQTPPKLQAYIASTNLVLRWQSQTNWQYTIQSALDVTNWKVLSSNLLGNGAVLSSVIGPLTNRGFYRLQAGVPSSGIQAYLSGVSLSSQAAAYVPLPPPTVTNTLDSPLVNVTPNFAPVGGTMGQAQAGTSTPVAIYTPRPVESLIFSVPGGTGYYQLPVNGLGITNGAGREYLVSFRFASALPLRSQDAGDCQAGVSLGIQIGSLTLSGSGIALFCGIFGINCETVRTCPPIPNLPEGCHANVDTNGNIT
jgi:hypothetical protein